MLKIGLTGGIASGKSAVAEMFAALGAAVVDTDLIAREVVAPGSRGLAAVRAAFGETVLASDGTLDRRRLRAVVFNDPELRARLEAILHPLIRTRTAEQIAAARGPYALVVVPLLIETDFTELVDRILVVDCPRETQVQRVIERDGVDRSAAEAMLAAQTDRATRLTAADDVIDNGGSLELTRAQVAELHRRYSELAHDCRSRRGRAE
jgi:dephospho-CoA kinase